MARTRPRGIKQPHPLGSVPTRSGVSQLVALAGSVTTSTGVKISELPPASSANGSDQFETNQGGISRSITVDQLLDVTGGAYLPLSGGEVTGTVAITPESGTTTRGLDIVQYGSGSGSVAFNNISLVEDVDGGAAFVGALTLDHIFGNMTGGRQTFTAYATLQGASLPATGNRNYVAIAGVGQALTPDGGTGTGYSTSLGGVFGLGTAGVLRAGATNIANVCAAEFNTVVETGASVYAKSIIQLSGRSDDRVGGSGVDAMIWAYRQGAAAPAWSHGILFDYPDDATAFPFDSGTTVLATGAGTVGIGIDFSSSTVTTAAFKSPGFSVGGTGALACPSATLNGTDDTHVLRIAGSTYGARLYPSTTGFKIEGTDETGGASWEPLLLGGSGVALQVAGVTKLSIVGNAELFTPLVGTTATFSGTVTALSGTAVGAGANTQAFVKASSTANLGIYYGTGAPSFTAAKGSLYSNTTATTTTTRLYVNTDGSTTWTNLTTAA